MRTLKPVRKKPGFAGGTVISNRCGGGGDIGGEDGGQDRNGRVEFGVVMSARRGSGALERIARAGSLR